MGPLALVWWMLVPFVVHGLVARSIAGATHEPVRAFWA
ncbi:MAG: hypothetical protein RL112_2135 [Planctomycetota bacterium]